MPTAFDVCVIGSANLDLVAATPRIPMPGETVLGTDYAEHAGGKGLNQAVAAARAGASTAFVGSVGSDDAGRRLSAVLAAEQIDSTFLSVDETLPTGRAMITVDDVGENSIVVIPGANGGVRCPDQLPDARVFLAQLEVPVEAVADAFEQATARGVVTVLNPAPARELPDRLLRSCTYVVPNEHEMTRLGGAGRLLTAGCRAIIVTLGSNGVEITDREGARSVPAFDVTPVDTTGAGDAFCGYLASRLATGADPDDAVLWAAAAGALATTRAGAVPAQPHAADVSALVGTRR